ncbi:MAG: DNA recombination protein RmuC [Armatimonadetes bacterium]|nr:DNA recombination protein RmuC [Armatimonadota bacterium]
MMEIALVVLGIAAGSVVVWLWSGARTRAALAGQVAEVEGRARAAEGLTEELRRQLAERDDEIGTIRTALEGERTAKTEAQTRLEEAHRSIQEQRALLDSAAANLAETFKALSADALRSNNQSFLDLARQSLQTVVQEARGDIGRRQQAIDALVTPLQQALARYEEHLRAIEESRQRAYGSLQEQLRALSVTQQHLQRETGNLVAALRTPQVRGRWGEITLRRVAELAGMSEHCDYAEQQTLESEAGRLRPDMIIRLPGGRQIIVDAKVPLAAYLDAVAETAEDRRQVALTRHAQQLRAHMNQLAAKAYRDHFPDMLEFVVMFVPGESFMAAAAQADRSLLEDAMARGVVLATPMTLITLMHTVAHGWRQERLAANAMEVRELGKQLYDRLGTMADHLADVGRSLERTVAAYNKTVGSLESRVMPSARRFRDLGAATGAEIPVLETIDHAPRVLAAPEVEEVTRPVP